jgi:NOL1/NOP2/fmu family ribosome biogenesis protein
MQIEKILSKKDVEEVEKIIEKNYGSLPNLNNYISILTRREKIWITTKEAFNLAKKIKFNTIGLYIGKFKRNDKIHLSLEGMQFFAKDAKKNIIMVNEENMKKFMWGSSITEFEKINCELNNFVLVKYKNDFIGLGILRENKVENLLPKSRRIL